MARAYMERFATPGEAMDDIWDDIAFLGRYGGQQRSEVDCLTHSERRALCAAVVRLLEAEHHASPLPGQGNDDLRGR